MRKIIGWLWSDVKFMLREPQNLMWLVMIYLLVKGYFADDLGHIILMLMIIWVTLADIRTALGKLYQLLVDIRDMLEARL